jgi:non-specific serine/threonine protein kinase
LHLGTTFAGAHLPPAYGFFRDLARDLVTALCASPDLEEQRDAIDPRPRPERLEELARAAPPMRGAEYVTPESLTELWEAALAAFRSDVVKHRGSVASYLHAKNPIWNLVGRVYFHLAENKTNEQTPFAFLATYTTRVSAQAKPQHRPLGKAVEESAGAEDRKALLALLGPGMGIGW